MNPTRLDSLAIFLILSALVSCVVGCTAILPSSSETLDWDMGGFVLVRETETGWKGVGGRKTKERIFAPAGATTENWTIALHLIELPIAVTMGGGSCAGMPRASWTRRGRIWRQTVASMLGR